MRLGLPPAELLPRPRPQPSSCGGDAERVLLRRISYECFCRKRLVRRKGYGTTWRRRGKDRWEQWACPRPLVAGRCPPTGKWLYQIIERCR